ncbi:hypothetical protein CLAFUW4_07218 [Fulvia fulva]|uniref:Uncharacterized protein n=1 Tax=Passalora fulva TaxID=5499 RepID=A0A9Q8PAD2_PASFU|nr:uncharacterized protein CLAFUR5_07351 [Fulvia fulva]KAK4621555.1 hypothetical protein CLAFUR4_07226 [Fulvia fulva]KAK4623188.1 hypothetical protein CLAFUR0_07223 [Fulvia fulva]UJO18831.1 hypothetical protein CLAFUR5_07351 [Fulvia fulva]WPV16767.1 hypothetical protein CLAFUW4_07218 [Fulvia fulva]WPV31352.1 hypothetical protein CLAFUW7_07219 [Fulvia fulva]
MLQLNYSKYVYQGGDLGGIIFHCQATQFPDDLISGHSNFWLIGLTADDLARYKANQTTVDETTYLNNLENYITNSSGYRKMQQTHPLVLAYALTDLPPGYAMWIYSIMREAVDPSLPDWTADQIITWSLMYLIHDPYAGLRIQKEMLAEGAFAPLEEGGGLLPYVKQPVAISEFPYDLW